MLGDDWTGFQGYSWFYHDFEGMKASFKEMLNLFLRRWPKPFSHIRAPLINMCLIMAFWGAPMKDKAHAYTALAAAGYARMLHNWLELRAING